MALVVVLLVAGSGQARAPVGWEPARTWVYAVGVLEWKDSESFGSFSKEGRRDRRLVRLFRDRGVPQEQVLYLEDREATAARIRSTLGPFLARAGRGDTLFLYYAGHGLRSEGGEVSFAPWDCEGDATSWPVREIVSTVRGRFRGSRALMAADCCYSGALTDGVRAAGGPPAWATLTSSHSRIPSTGNWTFTDCLLGALGGAPAQDANGDGRVTLGEAGAWTLDEMAFAEGQLATWSATPGFPESTVLGVCGRARRPGEGERLEVRWKGRYYRADVRERQGGRLLVHWVGFPDGRYPDEWVAASDSRPFTPLRYPVGAKVEVEWGGRWWSARVIEARADGLHRIHYEGWDDSWDEWVSGDRIRVRT